MALGNPGGAWDAAPYNIYNDGINGASYTTPAGDSTSGQLNLGQGGYGYPGAQQQVHTQMQGALQQLIQHLAHTQPGFLHGLMPQTNPQPRPIGIPDLPPGFTPPGMPQHALGQDAHQMPLRFNHLQTAQQLAQAIAAQSHAGLRRYSGRH